MSCTAVRPVRPRVTGTPSRPDARVGDAEREHVGTRLGQAFAQGYLTVAEYEERLDTALAARTAGALHAVLADLPPDAPARTEPARRAAARLGVRVHAAAYLVVVLVVLAVWAVVAARTGAGYFWPVWPILGGAVGLASHAVPVAAALRRR